jgi:hypothetical protein
MEKLKNLWANWNSIVGYFREKYKNHFGLRAVAIKFERSIKKKPNIQINLNETKILTWI